MESLGHFHRTAGFPGQDGAPKKEPVFMTKPSDHARADSSNPKMALDTANPRIAQLLKIERAIGTGAGEHRTYNPKSDPGATAQPKVQPGPTGFSAPNDPPPPPPSKDD